MATVADQTGERNPNWRGGRTVTEQGYVLLRRPGHPDADVRGYVYEHRLIAEIMLGRRLGPDEVVHHVNHDRADNRYENLRVLTRAEHAAEHRTRDDLRDPGEPNPLVSCECGCGEEFERYDGEGRPRRFVSGHNLRAGARA